MRSWRPVVKDLLIQAGQRVRQTVPKPWVMVEVGVMDGNTAAYILFQVPQSFVIMVDPWEPIAEYQQALASREIGKWKSREFDRMYARSCRVTEFASDRRRVVRCKSLDMVHTIGDGTVHLAFLDGDKRKAVLEKELPAWWAKIAPGGILCGHDWGNEPDVKPTVTAWAEAHKMELKLASRKSRVWYVEKAL